MKLQISRLAEQMSASIKGFKSYFIIKGSGGPSNTTVIILAMMLKVILGLHVSILLNHLQTLVFQIHTKNALRIVGSPTLTFHLS